MQPPRVAASAPSAAAVLLPLLLPFVTSLDNGLGLTPPMGFNPWNCFGISAKGTCKLVNPALPPPGCHRFNESVILAVADKLVSSGLAAAGYVNVNLDCGWTTGFRDHNGTLVTNTTVFPHGMKWLGDTLHAKGLKFGIYGDAGTQQCCSRAYEGANDGSYGHETPDADLWASFGVDFLKYDDCGGVAESYAAMRDALNATGRPIYYSVHGPSGAEAAPLANCWRTTSDIDNTWDSMLQRAVLNDGFAGVAGPGAFNDPDMLEVGNFYDAALGLAEARTQFSLWCAMKAPLLIGTDVTIAPAAVLGVLGNEEAIAINQDPLGIQARLHNHSTSDVIGALRDDDHPTAITAETQLLLWAGPLHGGDKVLAVVNSDGVSAVNATVDLGALFPAAAVGLSSTAAWSAPSSKALWHARDIWGARDLGQVSGVAKLGPIGPHDTLLLRLSPVH